jgi:hypothetical protein
MKWTDTQDIAIALSESHPDKDPTSVNFVDLYKWVLGKNPRGHPASLDRGSGMTCP